MKKKVVRDDAHKTDENWQMLANAICTQAAHDYEKLISDRPYDSTSTCNIFELKQFAREQTYTNLNMVTVFKIIEKNFKKKFKPYVQEFGEEIERNWKEKDVKHAPFDRKREIHPYFCPNCGGLLYPSAYTTKKAKYINCDGCNLNARYGRKETA